MTTGCATKDSSTKRKNIELISVDKKETIASAVKLMTENDFSQLPVTSDGRVVGSVNENQLLSKVLQNPAIKNHTVESVMLEAFPFVDITTTVESLSKMITAERPAVLVKDFKADRNYIITRWDIAEAMMR